MARKKATTARVPVPAGLGRSLGGKRLTVDRGSELLSAFAVVLPPTSWETSWSLYDLGSKPLERLPPHQVLDMLMDLSPEVSRALFDWLRLINAGWEVQVTKPGSTSVDRQGEALTQAFLDRLSDHYGSLDVVLNRLTIGALSRGALFAELILDEQGREPVDLATPDPYTVRFKRALDPVRGPIWVPGQWQLGQFVLLDRPTIRYLPIDPLPGSPYGRALLAPALFTSLFLVGLLRDLRRVVAQQGYPRIDITINSEPLLELMGPERSADAEERMTWLNTLVKEIQSEYDQLQPEDSYIHSDVVTVNRPVGTVDSSSLGAVDGLIANLERQAMRALKSTPLLMGIPEGMSEANANRQWEAHLQSVKSLQHLLETLLGRLCTLALQAQGQQGVVTWRFAENRASELLRDQQTLALKLANARTAYAAGFASQDEASNLALGHNADQPEPRTLPRGEGSTEPANPATVEAEPGVNREVVTFTLRERPEAEVRELVEQALAYKELSNGHEPTARL